MDLDRDPRLVVADLLDDAAAALRTIGPSHFRASGATIGSSPIGAHVRHVLDHFQSFRDGLAAGRIDYDARARDPRLETELPVALAAMREHRAALLGLPDAELDRAIAVFGFCGGSRAAATSTVRRELGYLACHAIHHFALVRLVARAHGVELAPAFGVAPSTIAAQAGHA